MYVCVRVDLTRHQKIRKSTCLFRELLLDVLFCHAAYLYVYTMCATDFMLSTARTNLQQQHDRRLADEDDELSEVQPGIFSAISSFTLSFTLCPMQ